MLRLILSICLIFAAGFGTDAFAASCDPSDNEVAFFEHGKYGGVCSVLGIGSYAGSAKMHMKNDSISSFKVGKNVQVTVCNYADGLDLEIIAGTFSNKSKCQTFKSSVSTLSGTRINNDTISAAKIEAKYTGAGLAAPGPCYPGDEAVAVYQHPDLGGNCRIIGVGLYENSKMMRFKNDSISSIEFGRNSRVNITVCQHSNFKGRCENLSSTDFNLFNNQIGDNSITSIKVTRR